MKKIGQKLSFLTKIMLVIGLLISNLSSLSVVFAYEKSEDLVIELIDEMLEIKYNETLAEEVENVDVKVYENYTYLDDLSEEEVMKVYSLTAEEVLAAKEGRLELKYETIFNSDDENVYNFELFDGTYSAKVVLVDTTVYPEETVEETNEEVITEDTTVVTTEEITVEETTLEQEVIETVIAENTYEEEIKHDSGLNIKVFDASGVEILPVDGKYPVTVDNSEVKVVAQVLSGGLKPTDVYLYNGEEYLASDLLAYEFSSTNQDFKGYLFGEYELPVEVKIEKVLDEETAEEVVYTDNINVLYESYEMNANRLNGLSNSLGYDEAYLFYSEAKNGILYVFPTLSEETTVEETVVTRTMLDVYNILNSFVSVEENGEQIINYTLFKNGVNVLESYDESTGVTLEEYLATVTLDDTLEVVLSNKGLTVTFNAVMLADLNNDNMVNSDDVLELINQVVGESEVTDLDKSNMYANDEDVNSLDVLYLNQVVKTKVWDVKLDSQEVSLNASLDVKFNDKELSEENSLTSGDEFTVDYVLSLSDYEVNGVSGLFKYDEKLFELVSVKVANEKWIGNSKDGKFLYLGEESLTGPAEETTQPEEEVVPVTTEEDNAVLEEETLDYVVVTATFKALKATEEGVITLEEIELYKTTDESVIYYVLDNNTVSTDKFSVSASSDNTLRYLEVAGIEITLEEEVYEYEITVSSDVTLVDLKYILNNVAANIINVDAPEELVEGENLVVLTVVSESGVEQKYTVKVTREPLVEETVTQVYYDNNYENDKNNQKEEVIVTEPKEEKEEEPEKESNLSRIVIIILILLVIAGLVYLIFKDEDDDETKKANKAVNRLKKESIEPEVVRTDNKPVNKSSSKKPGNNNSKNNKKGR